MKHAIILYSAAVLLACVARAPGQVAAEVKQLRTAWRCSFITRSANCRLTFVIEAYGDSEGYWVLHDKGVYQTRDYGRARWVRPGHYVLYDEAAGDSEADVLQLSLNHAAARKAFFSVLENPAVYHGRK